ncbi:hypothetical protein FGG08_007691, partial [Glutinoglossum americanum]
LAGDLRLFDEAFALYVIAGIADDLERHVTVQDLVASAQDDAHAAATELLHQGELVGAADAGWQCRRLGRGEVSQADGRGAVTFLTWRQDQGFSAAGAAGWTLGLGAAWLVPDAVLQDDDIGPILDFGFRFHQWDAHHPTATVGAGPGIRIAGGGLAVWADGRDGHGTADDRPIEQGWRDAADRRHLPAVTLVAAIWIDASTPAAQRVRESDSSGFERAVEAGPRIADLATLAQPTVGQHQRSHGLDDRHRARQHAGVVTALGLEVDVVAGVVGARLRFEYGCRRLEDDAQIDRHTVADTTLDAARAVGRGGHVLGIAVPTVMIVVFQAAEFGTAEAGTDLDALARRQAEERLRQQRVEFVEHRLTQAG